MNEPPLHEVAETIRDDASTLRRRGAEGQAEALESAADDVEDALRRWWHADLTLTEAAREQGCSYSKMQKMVASGEVRNARQKGDPRVRRCDLPRYRTERDPLARDALTAS